MSRASATSPLFMVSLFEERFELPDFLLDGILHLVDRFSIGRTYFGSNGREGLELRGDKTLFAQIFYPELLDLGERSG